MNNNIFIKLNKNKYNPDIESKLNNISQERTQTKFNLSKTIYNPITGVIPDKLNTQNDLVLQKDKHIVDIKSLISQKEFERAEQNEIYKPIKTKIVNNIIQDSNNLVKDDSFKNDSFKNNDYIKTYNELKHIIPPTNINQNNYNNILGDLKDLGIIK